MANRNHRRPVGVAARAGVVLAMAAIVATPAQAQAGLLAPSGVCVGTSDVSYQPGIKSTPATVTADADTRYLSCSMLGAGRITGARDESVRHTATRSCTDLLGTHPATFTITWNTGQRSTVQGETTTTQEQSVLVVATRGAVTSGPFRGRQVKRVTTYADIDALTTCQSRNGLRELRNGVRVMTLLPV